MFPLKFKLTLLFSCFFVFLLYTMISTSPVQAGTCKCTSFGAPQPASFLSEEECATYCGVAYVGEAPPPAEKTTAKKEEKAPPTCVITKECQERWQKAKEGILRNISVECYCCGDCGLNDIVNLFVGAANYIFGIVGALALLFFIYGGVLWLTAGGKAEQIEKGKKVLIGAVIGLVIIFGSWILVQFIMTALGVKSEFLKIFKATR